MLFEISVVGGTFVLGIIIGSICSSSKKFKEINGLEQENKRLTNNLINLRFKYDDVCRDRMEIIREASTPYHPSFNRSTSDRSSSICQHDTATMVATYEALTETGCSSDNSSSDCSCD